MQLMIQKKKMMKRGLFHPHFNEFYFFSRRAIRKAIAPAPSNGNIPGSGTLNVPVAKAGNEAVINTETAINLFMLNTFI